MLDTLLAPGSLPFVVAFAVAFGICLRRAWMMTGWAFPRSGAAPILSLGAFGAVGMAARSMGFRLEPWGPALAAGVAAFLLVGLVGKIPKTRHGSAWIGHSATVRRSAWRGHPGDAKLTEAKGKVLVEPLHSDERFEGGTQIVLVHEERGRYLAVAEEESGDHV